MSHKFLGLLLAGLVLGATAGSPAELLVEAEALAELGGWVVDQQSIDVMGSSYLLAHGLGEPVAAAAGTVRFPESGSYRMWVRTRDWVPDHPATPGTFKVAIDGVEQAVVFGTESADWAWQPGGMVEVTDRDTAIELRDQTGFDGRCDALYFTKDQDFTPPNELEQMMLWRDALLGRPATPADAGSYDLVVVGGGIAGCCAALAAARSGLEVALIHDRPVLGGNASQEVRVHTMGVVFGDIVGEVNTRYRVVSGTTETGLQNTSTQLPAVPTALPLASWVPPALGRASQREIVTVPVEPYPAARCKPAPATLSPVCWND